MRVAWAPRDAIAWLERRASCRLTTDARALAAVDSGGHIRAMVAFDDITGGSCELHVSAESSLALRALLPACYRYVFNELGLAVAIGLVPANNDGGLEFAHRLGFREKYRIRDGWSQGVDLLLHELRREDCARWLERAA